LAIFWKGMQVPGLPRKQNSLVQILIEPYIICVCYKPEHWLPSASVHCLYLCLGVGCQPIEVRLLVLLVRLLTNQCSAKNEYKININFIYINIFYMCFWIWN